MSNKIQYNRLFGSRERSPHRIVYLFTVLCLLVTSVLPANAIAATPTSREYAPLAASSAVGAACDTQMLAAGAELPVGEAIVMPAAADAPITLPKALVDRAVFYANWRSHYSDAEAIEALILTLFQMAGATDTQSLGQLRTAFQQRIPPAELNDLVAHPYDEIVYEYIDAALDIPALTPFVPYVWQSINAETNLDGLPVDSSLLIAQSTQRFDLGVRLLQHAHDYMVAAHSCASQNAAFAAGFNAMFAGSLKVEITADAKVTLQNNPDLSLPPALSTNIAANGTVSISLDDLKLLGDAAMNGLGESFSKMLGTIKEIDLSQSSIVDWFKNLLGIQTAKDKAKARAEAEEKEIKKYEEAVGALTTIFKQLDPALANTFKTVTSSYIDIVKSVNKWMQATAGFGSLDKIFSLSTVIMTGNVLGAVMNIVSIFGDGKPTPEQQILEQIGKLRQQVNELRTEMHARFDRIDSQLNTIYTTMNQRFDQIDITLGKINGNIRDVQRSLIEMDLRLSQLERNNFELLNVLGRRPLLDAINAGLDYKRITGTDMPFQPEFINFERTFHTWGTVHSLDPLNTGPSQRDYGDGDIFRELTTYPLDANLNYLNGWLIAHGRAPLANGMIASPRDWLLASRAYTQLGLEWPEHMARIDAGELTELEAVGLQIEQAIANITRQTVTAAEVNDSIFSFVVANYDAKFTTLDTGLKAIEDAWIAELRPGFADANATFELFGGAEQQVFTAPSSGVLWVPPGYTKIDLWDQENFTTHQLAVPPSITALVTAQPNQMLSEMIKLGGLRTRMEMELTETDQNSFPCSPPVNACTLSAHMVVTVRLYFGSVNWKTLVWDMGTIIRRKIDTPIDFIRQKWNDSLDDFDAGAVAQTPTPDEQILIDSVFANLKGGLDAKLGEFQQVLYARQIDSMASGPLHPLMVEIAGYKALIDAFTIMGLPRALQNDEFLHAMLFGSQRLYDDVLIALTLAEKVNNPIQGGDLLINQRPLLKQTALERSALYMELVQGYLDAIAAGESPVAADAMGAEATHTEAADYLVSARRALDLTVRISRIAEPDNPNATPTPSPTPSPTLPGNPDPDPTQTPTPPVQPGSQQIFLPLVDN